jgi:hypothetical protein
MAILTSAGRIDSPNERPSSLPAGRARTQKKVLQQCLSMTCVNHPISKALHVLLRYPSFAVVLWIRFTKKREVYVSRIV